ncbi:SDR family oxidoreductase [Brevundimonas diminuta]|uniref:SDR family oxidoreductase n=1 Tax=Brevundimonas diminuta TaxID=293 RepID=UPI003209EBF4
MTKTVLITGCSSGFGAASARLFAERGWNVIATMRSPKDGAGLPDLERVLVTRLDVQAPDTIESAIAEGLARFGRIDALVNNAGFGLFGLFEGTSREKIQEQFDVNLFGVMDVTRAILPHFRSRKAGVIVNVSSGAGVFGLPMISLYNASKFALEGFSESLSYELAPLGVTVKIVEPGGVLETSFGARSGAESGHVAAPSDYEPVSAASARVFEGLRSNRALATSADVAAVIFAATSDGSDQLRYVATEDIKPLVALRRESSEENYMATMREKFSLL